MAKLSRKQWQDARSRWEGDDSLTHEALAIEIGVSKQAVAGQIKRGNWARKNVVKTTKNVVKDNVVKVVKTTSKPAENKPILKPKLTDKERIMPVLPCEDKPEWEEVVEEKKAGKGRPPLYREGFAQIAYKICLLGATLEKLADLFGVSVETLYQWRDKYPDFCDALRQGREIADSEVAASLYQRATGYTTTETKVSPVDGQFIMIDVDKNYPPDTGAAKMWLYNRQPELWKDKREDKVTHTLDAKTLEFLSGEYEIRLQEARDRMVNLRLERSIREGTLKEAGKPTTPPAELRNVVEQ